MVSAVNSAALLCLFFAILATSIAASTYTTKYDDIDLDEILSNERIYKKYFDCLINKGKCSPDAKELKDNLSDALQTDCSKCSEKQKHGSEKVLKYLLNEKSADFLELEKIYDKDRIYRKKYEKEAKTKGLNFPV